MWYVVSRLVIMHELSHLCGTEEGARALALSSSDVSQHVVRRAAPAGNAVAPPPGQMGRQTPARREHSLAPPSTWVCGPSWGKRVTLTFMCGSALSVLWWCFIRLPPHVSVGVYVGRGKLNGVEVSFFPFLLCPAALLPFAELMLSPRKTT